MVVGEANINNIMSGIESTGGVRLHNHRKKLKQRFDIIKKLGQGTYGKVQLGINKETGQEVAIKTIKKCKIETEADLIRIRREIQIMSSVQHPNIIHIYEVFENREKMVLVMEYAAGGELYDYLSERKVLLEEEARRIFRQIATAVYYCHKHKICHRDLKLENILLDENGNAKIADFGLSNVFDETRLLSTFCGSPLYASPEIVKGTPYHGPEVDCWSLGVLLYTLVYGAMPFDGSNFKRLVKQISQGDYFEPKTPSPASPLIREMLTVSANRRADMEKICSHWWVNEGHDDSCFDIAEDLANQTPVRLDLLLSIAPPPPQIGSDKLVIASTENVAENEILPDVNVPTRSHSVGSIMERGPTQKIRDIVEEETAEINSPKRKLEVTVSTENANQASSGAKRKERSRKKDRDSSVDRRTSHRSSSRSKAEKIDASAKSIEKEENSEASGVLTNELQKNLTQTMEVEAQNGELPIIDNELNNSATLPQEEGAMCTELIEEASKKNIVNREKRKSVKTKKPKSENLENKILEESDVESSLPNDNNLDKENVTHTNEKPVKNADIEVSKENKVTKKKILGDNNEVMPGEVKEADNLETAPEKEEVKLENGEEVSKNEEVAQPPTKPIERRRSKIFETAEKFQNMASSNDLKTNVAEKPKKIFIPGVNVGGFKQAFERKASLTNSVPIKPSLSKKSVGDDKKSIESENKNQTKAIASDIPSPEMPENVNQSPEDTNREKVKHAVSVISSAIDREGARKSKSRPTMVRKPPVPFGISGRSASGGIAHLLSPLSPPSGDKRLLKLQVGPEMRTATVQVTTPEDTKYIQETIQRASEHDKNVSNNTDEDSDTKTSSIEVNLKSATLPRRKTSKAEITLSYPQPKPATMEFKTEMQHRIDNSHPKLKTQRSEVAFPVSAAPHLGFRSNSLEPEGKNKPKERIIPIALVEENQSGMRSPPTKPPAPRVQRTFSQGQRASSMSRQSTQDSDTDSTSAQPEPIKKSPREFIIPIAIEGGGYVTPRAGSLEPSESGTPTSKFSSTSRFGRPRRMNDREGSEDESPFSTLHRHGSVGRDSDNEDSRKDRIHLHRLRSTRPNKRLDHADSLSSGEEDDDDGFELLTAENLFSTLLSRVRSLTQRLNVEDSGRPGFPSSRLLSHFGRDNFWDSLHNREPFRNSFGRSFSRDREPLPSEANNGLKQAPWRRTSNSRFNADSNPSETTTSHTLPRGSHDQNTQDLNLSDLDLSKLKLSENDAVALSYLTPGLSRRIKQQLLSQLPPSQARKLTRTLSKRENSNNMPSEVDATRRCSEGQLPQTDHINKDLEKNKAAIKQESTAMQNNSESTSSIKSSFLNRRSISHDPNYKPSLLNPSDQPATTTRSSSREKFSPFSESSRSEFTDISSRSDNLDYQNLLSGIHNSDLTESDRRLLENYRKSREQRRALRSNSLLDSNRSSTYYKPPLPDYGGSNDDDKSVLSKYLSTYSSDPLRSRTANLTDYKSDYLKSRTLDRRNMTSTTPRRVSRFLRPDFYDAPPSDNVLVKGKSEREIETQKVLKEIRDKRLKKRLGLRETSQTDSEKSVIKLEPKTELIPTTPPPPVDTIDIAATKSKIAKLIRPKSFPEKRESPPKSKQKKDSSKESTPTIEQESKIKSATPPKLPNSSSSDEKSETKPSNRNKFLHSLEKKFEKLRSFSTTSDSSNNDGEKLSRVGNAIRRLREQSLPRTTEHITESGLIKRAISVEDLSSLNSINNNNMKISKRSVSKILNLFKKYEEPKNKKSISKATKDSSGSSKSELKKLETKVKDTGAVNIDTKVKSKIPSKSVKKLSEGSQKLKVKKEKVNDNKDSSIEKIKKIDKPVQKEKNLVKLITKEKSLEKEDIKKSPEKIIIRKGNSLEKEENKNKASSKLPTFRRSIDLGESSKLCEEPKSKEARKSLNIQYNNVENVVDNTAIKNGDTRLGSENPKRKSLQLDFSKLPRLNLPPADVDINANESSNQSPTLTENKKDEGLLSPRDDSSVENWSTSSPDYAEHSYHHPISDYSSALSPSGDESESVIDRIRRKSFYTRFNEKKKVRKSSLVGPGADYNNLSYKTVPRHTSLKDDSKIHLEPLSTLTFRELKTPSVLNESSLKHYEVDSYIKKKNSVISGLPSSPAYNSRRKSIKLSMDRDSEPRSSNGGTEDPRETSGSISRVNSYNMPSTPLNNIASDVNSNLMKNNNDSPNH